jgi:hypothetical protein
VPLRSRVRLPSSPLDGTFAGTVPGEAEVGETIGSLSRQRESRGLKRSPRCGLPHRVGAGI